MPEFNFDVGLQSAARYSTFTTWNRLEPRPRKQDFDRSLRAEVRDALWMLTRQWQWGEFKGEDTGSAIFAKVHHISSKMTRLGLGAPETTNVAKDSYSDALPLEAVVEQTPVPLDATLGLLMGQRYLKILQQADPTLHANLAADFLSFFPFDDPPHSTVTEQIDNAEFLSNGGLRQTHAAVLPRSFDGRKLYDYLVGLTPHTVEELFPAATYPSLTSLQRSTLTASGTTFTDWFAAVYVQPAYLATNPAWQRPHMEYQVAGTLPDEDIADETVDPPTPVEPTIVVAKEYYHGRMDWYSFDMASAQTALHSSLRATSSATETEVMKENIQSLIPSGIQFAGMPNDRWWEFEDARIDLGDLQANDTDLAKILVSEFGLVYGNEWSVIPFTVDVGTLSEVRSIVVTDVFGLKTLVEPAGRGVDNDWQRWNMYNLNVVDEPDGQLADNRLFIPPVIHKPQESEPLELVHFIRDEMSNMVWGIEVLVPDGLGGGRSGYDAAAAIINHLSSLAPPVDPDKLNDGMDPIDGVEIRYHLQSTMPENWIPFVPESIGGSDREIQLRRARMPRVIPRLNSELSESNAEFVKPRSVLLNTPLPPDNALHIYEEEVPRAGSKVLSTWQRVRWYDGRIVLWLGRRKQTGRGEGHSGLLFDLLKPAVKGLE